MNKILAYWIEYFELTDWVICLTEISKDQVVYDDIIPLNDRYYIGVNIDRKQQRAIIYHDRPISEECIVHELLHIVFKNFTEEQVNETCRILLLNNKECRYIKKYGQSCSLNNNCKYPNCK
jgi:hypothetical protein